MKNIAVSIPLMRHVELFDSGGALYLRIDDNLYDDTAEVKATQENALAILALLASGVTPDVAFDTVAAVDDKTLRPDSIIGVINT